MRDGINRSGKALDDYNWEQTNGTNVWVYPRHNATAQRWFIRGTAGAYFLNASCGSAVLDVANYGRMEFLLKQMKNLIYMIFLEIY